MKSITVSNFRSKLKSHLDEVTNNSEIIVIPRNNKENDAVVVMSISEYNAIKEMEYLLGSKTNHSRLQKSLEEANSGNTRKIDLDSL